ncbi:hypothetical protein B0H14DRAFT_3453237 [Mycena olivaceomarginata]|nr:hypothetical protein B0H14DRAFT_3453237 [Mycena olivaceomarginata]
MSLGPLSLHNAVEHEASFSRNDFGVGHQTVRFTPTAVTFTPYFDTPRLHPYVETKGDNVHINETVFATLANANSGVDFYASYAAAVQFAYSIVSNPFIVNTQLSIFGNPLTGVAPKKCIFFREERLLIEGWTKPTTLITSDTLAPI